MDINGSIDISGNATIFNVECSVNANPPAIINWFKTSEEVLELSNTSSTSITYQFTSDKAPITLSTLVINVTRSNNYMCMANNSVGDAVSFSMNFSLVRTGQCSCIQTNKGNECHSVEGIYVVFAGTLIILIKCMLL